VQLKNWSWGCLLLEIKASSTLFAKREEEERLAREKEEAARNAALGAELARKRAEEAEKARIEAEKKAIRDQIEATAQKARDAEVEGGAQGLTMIVITGCRRQTGSD
jgi:hypothetical protein